MITTIIFDAEGVVFDTETIWDRAQVEFLWRRGIIYKREELKPLLTGRSLLEGVYVMQRLYRFPGDPEVLAQERLSIVKEFLVDGVHFIDGFLDFFMQTQGCYKVCIATAMQRELFRKIEFTLNLCDMFGRNIFFIDCIGGKGKPHPDIFLYAAIQMQSMAQECLVIEDAPLVVVAAKRAGMKCVALTTTYRREKLLGADAIVDSFAQILKSDDLFKTQ